MLNAYCCTAISQLNGCTSICIENGLQLFRMFAFFMNVGTAYRFIETNWERKSSHELSLSGTSRQAMTALRICIESGRNYLFMLLFDMGASEYWNIASGFSSLRRPFVMLVNKYFFLHGPVVVGCRTNNIEFYPIQIHCLLLQHSMKFAF